MKNALELSLSATRLMVGDPPSSFALDDSSIPEDAALGTVVGTLSATDADGGSVLFSIGDQTVPFAISGDSLIVAGVLDFDTQPSWQFYIQAMGSRGGASLNQVTVTVTSVTETPNPDPLPPPVVIEEDGDFTVPTTSTQVNDAIKIHGKKAPGSVGKFIYDIRSLVADDRITVHWALDASLMSLQGRKVAVGFVAKQGLDFHFIGLQGDGTPSGVNLKRIYGDNKWNSQTGLTEVNDGAPANGTQYGGWFQLEVDASGDTYTIRTATDPTDQADFVDEITGIEALPFAEISDADQFGIGMIFQGDDTGAYSLAIDVYVEGEVNFDPIVTTVYDLDQESASGGWNGFTLTNTLAAANLAAPTVDSTFIRCTFNFDTFANGAQFSAWFGKQNVSGEAMDFTGDQVQLLFGGSGVVTGNGSTLEYVSDWIEIPQYDETVPYVMAAQFSGGTCTVSREATAGVLTNSAHFKLGADAATTNKTGYSSQEINTGLFLMKIEVADRAP